MQAQLWFRRFCLVAFFVANALSSTGVLAQTLKQIAKFDLPGPGGKRFDYLTIDVDNHYLISAHLAADQTYVIDLRTNNVVPPLFTGPRRVVKNSLTDLRWVLSCVREFLNYLRVPPSVF